MDHYSTSLELKTVDTMQRIISGYAAYHGNVDRVRDVIDEVASKKAVHRIENVADIGVYIGHDESHQLPVGIPLKIMATPLGLYTETKIKPGPAGDDLLETAKFMQENGQPLGMSIAYYTQDSRPDRVEGKSIRRILDYVLRHYCYASNQAVANPKALAPSVKTLRHKALSEGMDASGGMLVPDGDEKDASMPQYRVEQRGDSWAVLCDADSDGDADDNQVIGTYSSQEMANAVALALRRAAGAGDEDVGEEDNSMDGKTAGSDSEVKATWTGAYVNALDNSAFLYVEPGDDDEDGKRVPRSKRHFPYKDTSGKIDMPHLRDAIGRIPQSNAPGLDASKKSALQARARKMLGDASDGKTLDEGDEWKTGAAIAVRSFGYRLIDLSDTLASEVKAMQFLGEETKDGMRVREAQRAQLTAIAAEIKTFLDITEMIDRGVDGIARNKRYLAMLELATA